MNISVAMCTYNGERFLEEQLNSIARQSLPPGEVIICDDGSTDATEEIVVRFATSVPFPVHFHRNIKNLGSTKNFEQAIQLCTGELIALCDQDDVWFPEKLAVMADILNTTPAVAGAFSNACLIGDESVALKENLWHRAKFTKRRQSLFGKHSAPYQLIARDTVTGATLLFRSGYRDQILPVSPDWVHDGWIALILCAISELRPVPAHLMSYRLHAAQQIGAQKHHWYDHLSTPKQKALVSHRQLDARFAAMANKLDELAKQGVAVDAGIGQLLRRRSRYLRRRIHLLEISRTKRVLPALQLLPDYFRYQGGVVSLLRDLVHD